jgi:hypothetical protein
MMTRRDVPFVVKTVQDARRGRASLSQMSAAQHLASSSGLSGISGELTDYIVAKTNKPESHLFTWPGFLFGVTIGLASNIIARFILPPHTKKK